MRKIPTAEFLFPNWFNARKCITEFISGIKGWRVTRISHHKIEITLKYPYVYIYSKESEEDEKVEMLLTFPQEYQGLIRKECVKAMQAIVDRKFLNKWIYASSDDYTLYRIEAALEENEYKIIANGGLGIKGELSVRLGVYDNYFSKKWNLK